MSWTEHPIHFLDFEGSRASGVLEYGVAVLQRGRLLDVGTAAELRGGSVQAYTAQLMHGVEAVQAAEVEA